MKPLPPLVAAMAAGLLALLPAAANEPAHDDNPAAQPPVATVPPGDEHAATAAEPAKPAPTPSDEAHARESRSLLNLGASLTERGDFAAAEIAFRRVMNDRTFPAPDQCEALLGLARMYRKQGTFTKAVATYEKFLKLYPDDARVPDALLELGRSQRAMGAGHAGSGSERCLCASPRVVRGTPTAKRTSIALTPACRRQNPPATPNAASASARPTRATFASSTPSGVSLAVCMTA